jgi:hypothetical protein
LPGSSGKLKKGQENFSGRGKPQPLQQLLPPQRKKGTFHREAAASAVAAAVAHSDRSLISSHISYIRIHIS